MLSIIFIQIVKIVKIVNCFELLHLKSLLTFSFYFNYLFGNAVYLSKIYAIILKILDIRKFIFFFYKLQNIIVRNFVLYNTD